MDEEVKALKVLQSANRTERTSFKSEMPDKLTKYRDFLTIESFLFYLISIFQTHLSPPQALRIWEIK